MDKKRVIKNVLFAVFVPTVIVLAYYGYKFGKQKYLVYKSKKEGTKANEKDTNL